ncbi:unnamed protein product, partial [Schistosoma turkestanicum]
QSDVQFLYTEEKINLILLKHGQKIYEYVRCRSQFYQSIEQQNLMKDLIKEIAIQEKLFETTFEVSKEMMKKFTEQESLNANIELLDQ